MNTSILKFICSNNSPCVFRFPKMVLALVILLFLIGPSLMNAQNCDYYTKIHNAEDELISYNYFEASTIYKQIFTEYGDIYLKDLKNALMSAYHSKDLELLYFFTDLLNQWSIDSSLVDQMLNQLDDTSSNIIIDTLEIGSVGYGNTPLCTLTFKLNILDQSLRKSCHKLAPHGSYHFCGKEIRLLDSLILSDLLSYIESNGFPHLKEFCARSSIGHPFYVIFLHNLMWKRSMFMETLEKQIYDLKFHPQLYTQLFKYIIDNKVGQYDKLSHNYGLGSHILNTATNKLYILPIEDKVLADQINKNRKRVCLDSFEDLQKKIIFQNRNPEFTLIYQALFAAVDMDQSSFSEFFKNWDKYVVE